MKHSEFAVLLVYYFYKSTFFLYCNFMIQAQKWCAASNLFFTRSSKKWIIFYPNKVVENWSGRNLEVVENWSICSMHSYIYKGEM